MEATYAEGIIGASVLVEEEWDESDNVRYQNET